MESRQQRKERDAMLAKNNKKTNQFLTEAPEEAEQFLEKVVLPYRKALDEHLGSTTLQELWDKREAEPFIKVLLNFSKREGSQFQRQTQGMLSYLLKGNWMPSLEKMLYASAKVSPSIYAKPVWKKAIEQTGYDMKQMPTATFGLYVVKGQHVPLLAARADDDIRPATRGILASHGVTGFNPFDAPQQVFNNEEAQLLFDTLDRKPTTYSLSMIDHVDRKTIDWIRHSTQGFLIGDNTIDARYYPAYFRTGMDPDIKTAIENVRVKGRMDECQYIYDVANSSFYGNGSLLGQKGRLDAVIKAKNSVPQRPNYRMNFNVKYVTPVGMEINSVNSMIRIPKRPSIPNLFDHIDFDSWYEEFGSQFESLSGGSAELVVYNSTSSTGIWCGNARLKNGDPKIGVQTISNATTQLHLLMRGGLDFDKSGFAIQCLKPKAEVYDQNFFYTKIRNICAMNAPVSSLPQAILKPYLKSARPFSQSDIKLHPGALPRGNYSLMGWSPTSGFMHSMVKEFERAEENSFGIFFYADNLYIFKKTDGDVDEISADGAKMECSHDALDAEFELNQILSEYEHVDPETEKILRTIHMSQMVNAPVLLGTHLIRQSWLSSGYVETAWWNALKMGRIVSCIIDIHNRDQPCYKTHLSDEEKTELDKMADWSQLKQQAGGDIYLMLKKGYLEILFAYFGVTMKIEKENTRILKTLKEEKRVDMDFLGYGVSIAQDVSHLLGTPVYLTTLDLHRLYKMLAFKKSEYGIEALAELPADVKDAITCQSKVQSALIQGAWLDPDLREVIRAAFYRASIALSGKAAASVAEPMIGELLKEQGFSVTSGSSYNPLDLYQILKIMAHPDIFKRIEQMDSEGSKFKDLERSMEMAKNVQDYEVEAFQLESAILAPNMREIELLQPKGQILGDDAVSETSISRRLLKAAKNFDTMTTSDKHYTIIRCDQLRYMELVSSKIDQILRKLAKESKDRLMPFISLLEMATKEGKESIVRANQPVFMRKVVHSYNEIANIKKKLILLDQKLSGRDEKVVQRAEKEHSEVMAVYNRHVKVALEQLPRVINELFTKKDYNYRVMRYAVQRMVFPSMKEINIHNVMLIVSAGLRSVTPNQVVKSVNDEGHGTFIMDTVFMTTPKDRQKNVKAKQAKLPNFQYMKRALYKQYIMQNAGVPAYQIQKAGLDKFIDQLFEKGPNNSSPTYMVTITVTDYDTLKYWYNPTVESNSLAAMLTSIESLSSMTTNAAQRIQIMRGIMRKLGNYQAVPKANNEQAVEIIRKMIATRNKWQKQKMTQDFQKMAVYRDLIFNTPPIIDDIKTLPFVRDVCNCVLFRTRKTDLNGLTKRYMNNASKLILKANTLSRILGISGSNLSLVLALIIITPAPARRNARVKGGAGLNFNVQRQASEDNPVQDVDEFLNHYTFKEGETIAKEIFAISKLENDEAKINQLAKMYNTLFGLNNSDWFQQDLYTKYAIRPVNYSYLQSFIEHNPLMPFCDNRKLSERISVSADQKLEFEYLKNDPIMKLVRQAFDLDHGQEWFITYPSIQEELKEKGAHQNSITEFITKMTDRSTNTITTRLILEAGEQMISEISKEPLNLRLEELEKTSEIQEVKK